MFSFLSRHYRSLSNQQRSLGLCNSEVAFQCPPLFAFAALGDYAMTENGFPSVSTLGVIAQLYRSLFL